LWGNSKASQYGNPRFGGEDRHFDTKSGRFAVKQVLANPGRGINEAVMSIQKGWRDEAKRVKTEKFDWHSLEPSPRSGSLLNKEIFENATNNSCLMFVLACLDNK